MAGLSLFYTHQVQLYSFLYFHLIPGHKGMIFVLVIHTCLSYPLHVQIMRCLTFDQHQFVLLQLEMNSKWVAWGGRPCNYYRRVRCHFCTRNSAANILGIEQYLVYHLVGLQYYPALHQFHQGSLFCQVSFRRSVQILHINRRVALIFQIPVQRAPVPMYETKDSNWKMLSRAIASVPPYFSYLPPSRSLSLSSTSLHNIDQIVNTPLY